MQRLLRILILGTLFLGMSGGLSIVGLYLYVEPQLPSIESLRDVQLQVPLRVFTSDGKLVAEYGEQRRTPMKLDEMPQRMLQAVLAAEDERFYQHPGVDWQGLTRAAWHILRTGEKGPGGSTITMQVARNFFLGREKTYTRKLSEILLAFKIERDLSKHEILSLYLNKIFLGQRAYGVGAAAQVYYGTELANLSLAQIAMIAGLPKAPSRFNPVVAPERAASRRDYVLGRMLDLGYITRAEYEEAAAEPVSARVHALVTEVEASYAAELARLFMEERFGEEAYTRGYHVYLTADSRLQEAATFALRKGLMNYDVRHGFRGPEMNIPVPVDEAALKAALHGIPRVGGLAAAVVTRVDQKSVLAYTLAHGQVEIAWEGLSWARRYINEDSRGAAPKSASDLLAAGDVIRVAEDGNSGWALSQIPDVEGALVAMDPDNGAIRALAGGFDFFRSKFNRVTQAERQPGSNFKPFVYAAAMDKGFTPASIINDAPVVFADAGTEGVWRPENYSGKFFGPTRLREALYHSRNLVSVRLMSAIGVPYTVDYLQRFGFSPRRLPPNLTLALGTATLTPLEMARGFGVFANGGYLVDPHIVAKVTTSDGSVVFEAKPKTVCRECEQARAPALMPVTAHAPVATVQPLPQLVETAPLDRLEIEPAPRVIPEQTAWLMTSMLRDVVKLGTGRRALSLQRNDLGGKTGTTNDQKDVWFSGYNASLVATVWMGFDQLRELGARETGSSAALPVWIDFMDVALRDVPERVLPQPSGLVTVRIDPETGDLAAAGSPGAILETFPADRVPTRVADGGMGLTSAPAIGASADSAGVPQQLF